jgi:hypothetical protein
MRYLENPLTVGRWKHHRRLPCQSRCSCLSYLSSRPSLPHCPCRHHHRRRRHSCLPFQPYRRRRRRHHHTLLASLSSPRRYFVLGDEVHIHAISISYQESTSWID